MKVRRFLKNSDGVISDGGVFDIDPGTGNASMRMLTSNPNLRSFTYCMADGSEIRWERFEPDPEDTIIQACDILIGPNAERMDAFAMLIGNLCPTWDEELNPPLDRELFDRICKHFGLEAM